MSKVVKIVFLIDPSILRILKTINFVCNVLNINIGAITVEESALEQLKYCLELKHRAYEPDLYSKNTKDDKEGATNKHNIANRFERRKKG